MNKLFNKCLALFVAAALMIMTGCEMETSSSSSQINKSNSQSEETEITTEKDTESNVLEQLDENTDKELGIPYPRPSGSPPLKSGSNGDEVCWLQTALNRSMDADLSVDGGFGNGTASKVIEFQTRCGLTADGVVGASTIAMLVDILSGNKTVPEEAIVTTQKYTEPPVREVTPPENQQPQSSYVLNTNTHKFHYPSCSSVNKMKDKNKQYYTGTREEVIAMGYDPCQNCHP